MKWYWYIVFVIVIILASQLLPDVLNNKVTENEIWWEYYQIPDGSGIRIIHSHKCNAKKPFIAWNIQCKILRYQKQKIDVYDYCIHEDDADMLNYISKRNIKNMFNYMWDDVENEHDRERCKWKELICDTTTFRKYEVAYSMKEGKLIPQNDDGRIIADYYWKTNYDI